MKRLHVHIAVGNIEQSTKFYTSLFGSEPAVQKEDYAKWMLDDPRVNFAISARGREPGLDHLGIQTENESELKEVSTRLKRADLQVFNEGATTCCYAKSEKAWVVDPQGIAWETFLTTGEATVYGDDNLISSSEIPMARNSACCAPDAEAVAVQIDKKRG
ncbi:MAG: ArsI/CadI family heavy metal resistance metalloenzyme [Candidatus Obscuribacterales bacterium]